MAWAYSESVQSGQYIMAEVSAGFAIDLFSSYTAEELQARVREYAQGWTPVYVQFSRGLAGVGATLRVFGRATSLIGSSVVKAQTEAALNSFWMIGGVTCTVSTSSALEVPADSSSQWSTTLQIAALAALVVGLGWLILQVRKTLD